MSKCVKCGSELPIINEKEVEFCPVCGKKNIKNIESEPVKNWLPVYLSAVAFLGFIFNLILCLSNNIGTLMFAFSMSISLASTSLGWITLAVSANNYITRSYDKTNDFIGIIISAIAIVGNFILAILLSGNIKEVLQVLQYV